MTEQRAAYDDFERRQHWYKLACEYGQKEDFLALIAAERRDAVEEYKRKTEGNCLYLDHADVHECCGEVSPCAVTARVAEELRQRKA